jgi:DnaJ-class molecular chaperone
VFDHIQFPWVSVFDRLSWDPNNSAKASASSKQVNDINHRAVLEKQSMLVHPSVHSSVCNFQRQDFGIGGLNLDLNLGLPNIVSGNSLNSTSSTTVLCQRCHSSSHPRHACKAPIKCDTCFGWCHVAASCQENWRPLDNFAKDCASFDYSNVTSQMLKNN